VKLIPTVEPKSYENNIKICLHYYLRMWTSYDLEIMQDSIRVIAEVTKNLTISSFKWVYKSVVDFTETEFFQSNASAAIFTYSRLEINIYLYAKSLYQEYYFARILIDSLVFINETIKNMTSRKRIESPDNWVHICSTHYLKRGYHIGDGKPIYTESYRMIIDPVDFESYFQTSYENNRELKDENSAYEFCDTLIIAKSNNKYCIRRCDDVVKKTVFPMEPSKSKFLSVQYFSTQTSEPIVLHIPKTMYMINNELFSPGFVHRVLEYQDEPFDFDLGYVLKIMDSDINTIELNRTQYILLRESSYSIEKI